MARFRQPNRDHEKAIQTSNQYWLQKKYKYEPSNRYAGDPEKIRLLPLREPVNPKSKKKND